MFYIICLPVLKVHLDGKLKCSFLSGKKNVLWLGLNFSDTICSLLSHHGPLIIALIANAFELRYGLRDVQQCIVPFFPGCFFQDPVIDILSCSRVSLICFVPAHSVFPITFLSNCLLSATVLHAISLLSTCYLCFLVIKLDTLFCPENTFPSLLRLHTQSGKHQWSGRSQRTVEISYQLSIWPIIH